MWHEGDPLNKTNMEYRSPFKTARGQEELNEDRWMGVAVLSASEKNADEG